MADLPEIDLGGGEEIAEEIRRHEPAASSWVASPLAETLRALLVNPATVSFIPIYWSPAEARQLAGNTVSSHQAQAALEWAERQDAEVERIQAEVSREVRSERRLETAAPALRDALRAWANASQARAYIPERERLIWDQLMAATIAALALAGEEAPDA